jgi:hypothetical protein
MSTYEEALAAAQATLDAAKSNALTVGGGGKYSMDRANTLTGIALVQLGLADHLKAIAPGVGETPAEASLGLLLRLLEDGGLEKAIEDAISRHGAASYPHVAQIAANIVRGIVYAAPTEQRVTLASEGERTPRPPMPEGVAKLVSEADWTEALGKFFPSYRDATYKTADYPPKETVGPKCNVINDNGVMCQYPYHHDDWINPHSHSWEDDPEPEPEPDGDLGEYCRQRKPNGLYKGRSCVFWNGHGSKHSWEV